jgi:hypothetical protein
MSDRNLPWAIGKQNTRNYTSQEKWTSNPGETMQTNEKYPSGKAQTFSYGGIPQLVIFRSKKPTICRGTIKIRLRRAYGVRSGTQHSGLKCPSSSGSQSKTASSPGTISKSEVS